MRNTVLATLSIVLMLVVPAILFAAANDNVDLQTVTRIRHEGFRNSKVMETMGELTDRIGPRLTGSASHKRANEWTSEQLKAWGLANAHMEPFPFGRGWALESVSVRMLSPDVSQLYALPKAWTPSTPGPVRGEVVRLTATTKEDLEKQRGNYAGKMVLIGDMREVKPQSEPALRRYDENRLREIGDYQIPGERRQDPTGQVISREDLIKRFEFQRLLQKFFVDEKPAAVIEPSRGEAGLIFVQGTNAYKPGESDGVPQLVMSIENYGRISRLLDRKIPVQIEVEVKVHFEDGDGNAYNTIAEIPGSDKKDEIVMAGAHIDSWHGGTGATDNAAGCAVTMEALRILQSLGIKPRRTIRIGLWGGEEQGLLGSRAYVAEHFGKRPEPKQSDSGLPSYLRPETGPLMLKPKQQKISAYFNIDNGTGKLRGIYLQENSAARPVIEPWMEPFKDLGFNTISMRNTGSTDHVPFDAVGIPGFQFIQDPVEYMTRTHHSNADVYERVQREDMMQASVILASFLYDAAMRDEMLPRKPLPNDVVWETPKDAVLLRSEPKKAHKKSDAKTDKKAEQKQKPATAEKKS